MIRRRSGPRRGAVSSADKTRSRTSDAANRKADELEVSHPAHWSISPEASEHELKLTVQCISDIADPLTRVEELGTSARLTPSDFRRQIRNISVPVRKLILSGGERFVRRCFIPRMHSLKVPTDQEPVVLNEGIGDIRITYTVGNSTEEQETSYPTKYSHQTVVKPLYGLRRIGDKEFQLEDPFDWYSNPIRDATWLNSRVIQVDDTTLSIEQLLRIMVNREGAHTERNEMLELSFRAPMQLSLSKAEDETHRKANTIKFGGISYVQLFTYLVGIYLVNMLRASLKYIPNELLSNGTSRDTWETIFRAPTEPTNLPLLLDKNYAMGAVFHSTNDPENPFELVGDYETPSISVIQIPS